MACSDFTSKSGRYDRKYEYQLNTRDVGIQQEICDIAEEHAISYLAKELVGGVEIYSVKELSRQT